MQIILKIRTWESFHMRKKRQYNMDAKGRYKVHIKDDVNFSNM